jgi:membrane peptidoglycan carboxypeptidase
MKWRTKLLLAAGVAVISAAGWWAWEAWRLPSAAEIRERLFTERALKGRGVWVPLWAISPRLQTAVVVWEDPKFFHHSGLDLAEIGRASWTNLRAGSYRRGASTITQQVARNLFLDSEKTLRRKLREVILARRMERALSKDEILVVYLNIAEWGEGIVGAEESSRRYFGKSAADLEWAEAALLAGILPNPRERNPCSNPARAQQARYVVLAKLLRSRNISQDEFDAAAAAPCCPCFEPPALGQ